MKQIFIGLVIGLFIIGIVGAIMFTQRKAPKSQVIMTFGECVRAGFPVQESDPRVCRTPDGKSFEEDKVGTPGVGL